MDRKITDDDLDRLNDLKKSILKKIKKIEKGTQLINDINKEMDVTKNNLKRELEALSSWFDYVQDDYINLITPIYWDGLILQKEVSDAIGIDPNSNKFSNYIKPKIATLICQRCNCNIHIECGTATKYKSVTSPNTDRYKYCDKCKKEIKEIRRNKQEKDRREIDAKIAEQEKEVEKYKLMPYEEYLKTNHWQRVRKRALSRHNHRCVVCDTSTKTLDVHHKTYIRLGKEKNDDVTVLCRTCHQKFHETK